MNVTCKLKAFQINSIISRQDKRLTVTGFMIKAGSLIKLWVLSGQVIFLFYKASMPALGSTWHATYLCTYLLTPWSKVPP